MDLLNEINDMLARNELYIKYENNNILNIFEEVMPNYDTIYDHCVTNNCTIFMLFKGEKFYQCRDCDQLQNIELKNEYCETAELLGYNPDPSPLLSYSDSYFYCKHCGEYNFYDNDYEALYDYVDNDEIVVKNYKFSNIIYIYNKNSQEIKDDKITLDYYETYAKNTLKAKTITKNLSIDEMLVNFDDLLNHCIINDIDPYDLNIVNNIQYDDFATCTEINRYVPYIIHEKKYLDLFIN